MSLLYLSPESYHNLIKLSVSDFGNSSRLNKATEKARSGPVTIGFLGGSVTIGYSPSGMLEENYPTQLCRMFTKKFGIEGQCNCVNFGLGSENSILGLAFAEDRLRKEKPDIVFVEYAINNGIDKLHMAAFESLITKLLRFESKPAVIPVIVCNAEYYTCSSYMELTAKHYALPAVNIYNVIKAGLENGLFEWSEYSSDYGHPTVNGHRLIADCIMELLEQFHGFVSVRGGFGDIALFFCVLLQNGSNLSVIIRN
jgi:lysophospholipase L1-like esterase